MATPDEIVHRYNSEIDSRRRMLTLMKASARKLSDSWGHDWPSDGFAHHAGPNLAFTCLTDTTAEDVIYLASDGSLWTGWDFADDWPKVLERVEIDVYEPGVEQSIKWFSELLESRLNS